MMIKEQNESSSVEQVGGKGLHLQKLYSWGAPVPPFFIISTDCFDFFQKNGELPSEVIERFDQFFLRHEKIALRSSMISEDQADASFAGLFETILDVTKTNWRKSLETIFLSTKSPRVIEYISKKSLNVELKMAVVVQELIEVEKSGVLFTRSPISPTALIAIDAGFGLGEGVVSGLVDVDHYQFTRNLELVTKKINNQNEVLNSNELTELLTLALTLEKKTKYPSDIEWGFKNNKITIFQIRPITRSFQPITYFVDTNLSESYPGVVSPFTANFVKKAYENVFKESALLLGANEEKFKKLSFHYEKLISCVDNHLYYNLEHYYAVLRALPGGEKNISNWHRMIGGQMDGVEIPYHATAPSFLESVSSLFNLIKLGVNKGSIFNKFIHDLNFMKLEIQKETEKLTTSNEIINYLNHLINRPLGFGLTVINDIFIMIGLGMLTSALKRKGFKENDVIDLLKTSHEVDSIKPLEHFEILIKSLGNDFIYQFKNYDFKISMDPYTQALGDLEKKGFSSEVNRLKEFLDLYGDRSFEELKLESLPLKNNPALFLKLIDWCKSHTEKKHEPIKREMTIPLGVFEKIILNFTKEAISIRESTRLWRGKFYHLLRELILKLSEELSRSDSHFRDMTVLDFFSLTHDEWKLFAQGLMTSNELQDLMNNRRGWQQQVQIFPEIIPWVETEPLPSINFAALNHELSGQGVSPGEIEGYALVLDSPHEAFESSVEDFILVTKNTDPAWVYIMSRSKGLISEKGSLLSHTAIIGRELNIPTIVGVKGATKKIKSGEKIRMNAAKGTIQIL